VGAEQRHDGRRVVVRAKPPFAAQLKENWRDPV
jgi:hypothetical protein